MKSNKRKVLIFSFILCHYHVQEWAKLNIGPWTLTITRVSLRESF